MKTLNPNVKRCNFYFDVETYKTGLDSFLKGNNEHLNVGVYSVGVAYYVLKSGQWLDDILPVFKSWIGLDSMSSFLDYLEEVLEKEKPDYVDLYAFNISYDFKFLRNEIVKRDKNGERWRINAIFCGDDKMPLSGGVMYKDTKMTLKCLYAWKPSTSLATWLKEITKKGKKQIYYIEENKNKVLEIEEKLTIWYEKWEMWTENDELFYLTTEREKRKLDKKEELEYLKIDVLALVLIKKTQLEITRKFIDVGRLGIDQNKEKDKDKNIKRQIYHKKTVASISKGVFSYYAKNGSFDSIYRKELKHDYDSYRRAIINSKIGGFTVGCDITAHDENIKSYDVNSMYPFVMSIGIPAGDILEIEDLTTLQGKELFYEFKNGKYELGGDFVPWVWVNGDETLKTTWKKSITWKGKKINLPKFDNAFFGKTFFNKVKGDGFFVTKLNWELLNKVCNHNLTIKPLYYVTFIDKQVGEYINKLYTIKQTETGELKNIAKLGLNSLYGKAIEGIHIKKVAYGFNKQKNDKYRIVSEFNTDPEISNESVQIIQSKDYKNVNILGGVYVTNMARHVLLCGILDETLNGNAFLYADTDSIKIIEKNPVKLDIDEERLGAWKFEGSFNRWRYPQKHKRYGVWNAKTSGEIDGSAIVKFGGLPTRIVKEIKKTPEFLDILLNPKNNVIFLSCKTTVWQKADKRLPVIIDVDFMTNNEIEPTHLALKKETGKWEFTKNLLELKNREIKKVGKKYVIIRK